MNISLETLELIAKGMKQLPNKKMRKSEVINHISEWIDTHRTGRWKQGVLFRWFRKLAEG